MRKLDKIELNDRPSCQPALCKFSLWISDGARIGHQEPFSNKDKKASPTQLQLSDLRIFKNGFL